jgi:riboflavin kinase/FMN adenylyltransferase
VRVYKDLKNISVSKPVVTIGTFDGVHLGHHKVLDKLKEIADQTGGESVVFTFYPHPRQVLTPDEQNLRLLTTLDEKIELLGQAGIDHLVVYPFTLDFAKLSYSEFVKSVLVDQIHTSTLVVGYDHRFGKNREGSYEDLKKCADLYGFDIIKLDVVLANEASISSTRIRNALESGDIRQATRYLGYHYTLHGRVVEGQQLGRTIGFPTANIESSDVHKLIPGYGVYAVFVLVDGVRYRGMMNIGTRPTFNNNADNRSIEVNLFDFDGHLYDSAITLVFVDKIRDERKFPDKEALVMQLYLDRHESNRILDNEMSI